MLGNCSECGAEPGEACRLGGSYRFAGHNVAAAGDRFCMNECEGRMPCALPAGHGGECIPLRSVGSSLAGGPCADLPEQYFA